MGERENCAIPTPISEHMFEVVVLVLFMPHTI